MSDSEEPKSKRSRRETSYKAKAFSKFKDIKSGKRNKYEIGELESVYEIVEEKEYVKRVLDRQDDDWIVDDDGSGYVEDGRDIFDDDLDRESIANASINNKKGTKRKKNVSNADNVTKGNLHLMLSNMTNKKKEEMNQSEDAMLSEILEEIDNPDISHLQIKSNVATEYSLMSRKLAAQNYMKSFISPQKQTIKKVSDKIKHSKDYPKEIQMTSEQSINDSNEEPSHTIVREIPETQEVSCTELNTENILIEQFTENSLDGIDFNQIEEVESMEEHLSPVNTIDADILQMEFLNQSENNYEEMSQIDESLLDKTDIPLVEDGSNKKVFRFYWWDAYEDPEAQKGVVFLFGKTFSDKLKSYVSCCVAVRNISRRVFILPRAYELNNCDLPTEEPVTFKKLYNEVNETIIKPLHISTFRTRYISKKYCFDPNIPTESDYMELRYPATDPKIDITHLRKTPKTFSKIFGANTSFLEILLLERKIKGPCWLDINNPVPVSNTVSWCKFEVDCTKLTDLQITSTDKPIPPPPLVVAAINLKSVVIPKYLTNEIVMVSCISHNCYSVDKGSPTPYFQQHFCVFSCPSHQMSPLNIHEGLNRYKATKVQKMNSERALLNYFTNQFSKIDPDLIVGHDLQGYQINLLAERLTKLDNKNFSKFSRLKRSEKKRLENNIFSGRLVCDIKVSAKELIKSKSYDLDTLCQVVLKLKENQRLEFEPEDVIRMYRTTDDLLKLISFIMQDTAYILRIMYDLNIIPLALQITNIAGNVLSRTLLGGRSERNEYLLLHAFSEKNYIVPDKEFKSKETKKSNKKPTYSGGLVLEPKVGFYDTLVLVMDFNSLYPSIIQEYNICFTTLDISRSENESVLPDRNLSPGILPTEIRKLVESRRQVKSLMSNPDISNDLRMQYNIRQMALKLTANSMYGCLGFSNSRFYAKNLASLVTHKGREILTHTRDLVENLNFEVVYGDTDSIMINTNLLDYDQVFKIGTKIKQEVNKFYKQVELDIDGVFKYLLLLKKKKYAAVSLSKNKDGKLILTKEYKGLDIVRRDWSVLASQTGKYILDHILSDLTPDERISRIRDYLIKIKDDLNENRVPIPLLVITKQLTKDPKTYTDKNSLPHVQVALRYNEMNNGHLRAGDTIPYIICDDGTDQPPTKRGYHIEELKNSRKLKVDVKYYLNNQLLPVISRICDPIEGIDSYQIAEFLGLENLALKKTQKSSYSQQENVSKPEVKFRNADNFTYYCYVCKTMNIVEIQNMNNISFLDKCSNPECNVRPVDYLPYIQNQLTLTIQNYIKKYYENELVCEDPACSNVTSRMPLKFVKKYPVCTLCHNGVMYREYTEEQLHTQISYFQYLFNIVAWNKRPVMREEIESAYNSLMETVEKFLNFSGYAVVDLTKLFSGLMARNKCHIIETIAPLNEEELLDGDDF